MLYIRIKEAVFHLLFNCYENTLKLWLVYDENGIVAHDSLYTALWSCLQIRLMLLYQQSIIHTFFYACLIPAGLFMELVPISMGQGVKYRAHRAQQLCKLLLTPKGTFKDQLSLNV